MSVAEDQDAVGEFGSDVPDESFGAAVRLRPSGRDLPVIDPRRAQDGSKAVDWPTRSPMRQDDRGAVLEVHNMDRLWTCRWSRLCSSGRTRADVDEPPRGGM